MPTVIAVSVSPSHSFSKQPADSIKLITGKGVQGDAHFGETVKHRSRVKVDPGQPNLRQVHLVHIELIHELQRAGFNVEPGTIGENITTENIDLLGLPEGTILHIGDNAKIKITGLRNPCAQLDNYQQGLTSAVLDKDKHGNLIRKSGVMAVVLNDGEVSPGNEIRIELPVKPHRKLEKV